MKVKFNPKVTIVIPVYNGSKYMKEAIDSALNQTYRNIEIIIVNDGSNDNGKTEKVALSYGNKIRYFKKENGGVSTALNLAISKMTGEYFSWLSHDDVYYPNKVEAQVNYLANHDLIDKNIILYSDYDLINEKSKIISECIKNHKMLVEKPEYGLLRGSINGLSLFIPKKAFDEFGLFDENLRCAQDYEMWLRMTAKYQFQHMEGILVQSRSHSRQVSITNPRVLSEGENLWTNMVQSLSKKDMERLEGSEYSYYKEMAKFLSETPYIETAKFCDKKYHKLEKEILKNIDDIKVSVIIPFYNRLDLVKKAVNSVIHQTHENIEIIIVNDGSTEKAKVIADLAKKDKRIKYIDLEQNKGAANARNVGMDNATGEYIAFLDSDDLFKKKKIEEQLKQMVLNGSKVSHTSYLRKGFDQEIIINSGTLNGKAIPTIIYSCGIATPTVMIKRKYLNSKKYRFNANLVIGEDTCFWLELLRNTKILGIDEPLTIVNVLESSAAYNMDKQLLGLKTILNYVLNDKDYSKCNYEIALLCKTFINTTNDNMQTTVADTAPLCPNCYAIMNSRSWKITKPLRLASKGLKCLKTEGLKVTAKKIINKITNNN
ncbi:MAG: glycosyltransferase [Bacilli bacterium]|jgi:hypothetical protein